MTARTPAFLVLEDGSRHEGIAYGVVGQRLGEVVFATGMTGYQETITDPSYAGQIVVMTAPHIGVTGVNEEDPESSRVWVEGLAVRDPARVVSNHRATGSLDAELERSDVVGIAEIDTRAVTRRLRDTGSMRGGIFSGAAAALPAEEQLRLVREAEGMHGRNLSAEVSTPEPYVVAHTGVAPLGALAVMDLGIKRRTIDALAARGFAVHVLPQTSTFDDILAIDPVGVFYSNGPGDPAASDRHVAILQEVLRARLPFFGICFGNQLLGRALGFPTYKLGFGHRGINQPVQDRTTGRVEVTSHNHGFAVDMPTEGQVASPAGFGLAEVTHVNLNDGVVEGLRALERPACSVQYHPEAAAGPHDASYLFDRFAALVKESRAQAH